MKTFHRREVERKLFKSSKVKPAPVNGKDLASLHILIPIELRKKLKARARAEGRSLGDLLTEVLSLIFWHENL
jgi:hypothetical protein